VYDVDWNPALGEGSQDVFGNRDVSWGAEKNFSGLLMSN
jgi:hypothetical protein